KHQVLDYLIKPVSTEELMGTIQKFILKKLNNLNVNCHQKVRLVTPNGMIIVEHNEIVFCEAIGNNSKIFFSKGNYSILSKPMIDLEKQLSFFRFLRIHKSYLINLNHVIEYSKTEGGYVVLKHYETVRIPISKNSRETLINLV
ncbi:MAG: response regulator transcription factor, partial [Cytophagales bacterium]